MRGATLVLVLAVSTAAVAATELLSGIDSAQSLSSFQQSFYREPRPELVPQAIRFVGASDLLEQEGAPVRRVPRAGRISVLVQGATFR